MAPIDHSSTPRWLLHDDVLGDILAPIWVALLVLAAVVILGPMFIERARRWSRKRAAAKVMPMPTTDAELLRAIYAELHEQGAKVAALTEAVAQARSEITQQHGRMDGALDGVRGILRELSSKEVARDRAIREERERIDEACNRMESLVERLPSYGPRQ